MVFSYKIMTFITSTFLLYTTVSAVTVQVLAVSSGAKKGSKKTITRAPINKIVTLLKHSSTKKQRAKKTTETKRVSILKCDNVLKIHDFVLYPLKAIIPVKDVYIVNSNYINSTKETSDKKFFKISKKSSDNLQVPKTTRKSQILKAKKKSPTKLKLLKSVKKTPTKRNVKRRKKKSGRKTTGKGKTLLKSEFLVRKTLKRTGTAVQGKTSLPVRVNENTMVLSADQFVFRPAIPINETNYPLDNADKLELYAQDTTVDKVLSYSFTDPAIKNYIKFPSVSKIIEETISEKTKQILANWRQKMIDDLGEEGFFNHSEALKVRGTEFHMAVRNAVLGNTTENCSEVTQNSLKSLSWMLEHISNPMAVESTIAHPKLGYRGVADCIAMFRNIPVIIDWKLSDKPKRDLKDTYDAPVQITAYIGALNHDPNYKWGVNHGLVAVAYSNGDPCDVFLLAPKHCQIYWRHWLMRFDKFKARSHLHLEHNIDEKSLELI